MKIKIKSYAWFGIIMGISALIYLGYEHGFWTSLAMFGLVWSMNIQNTVSNKLW